MAEMRPEGVEITKPAGAGGTSLPCLTRAAKSTASLKGGAKIHYHDVQISEPILMWQSKIMLRLKTGSQDPPPFSLEYSSPKHQRGA